MNRVLKVIVIGISVFGIGYLTYFIMVFASGHSTDWEMDKQYLWIFKDSVKKEINTDYSGSWVKSRDICTHFHYRDYKITVWEFKDLSSSQLSDISIYQDINLSDVKFKAGETLNNKGDMRIGVKFAFELDTIINVNVDTYSLIHKNIEGSNYKGFLGDINRFSFSNKGGWHQIIVDYAKGKTSTLLLFYKNTKGIFLIIINPKYNSKNPIDEGAINILNLE